MECAGPKVFATAANRVTAEAGGLSIGRPAYKAAKGKESPRVLGVTQALRGCAWTSAPHSYQRNAKQAHV